MPKHASLDELIARKAQEYADQIKAAAAMADKEEEIRIESEKQLAFIQKDAGIKLEGKHEFTVASGRVDSVYSRVIIEYKNPKSAADKIGPKADSPGSKKVVEQIKKRFYDMRTQHGQPLNSLFGVGLDGNYFIFVRFRDEKWQVQEPVEVNRHSAERFLWALFNLGNKGKPFSPEYLAGDFGSEGGNTVAIGGIHALYDAIKSTDNPKAQTFFSQWKILFGEVCGYDVDNPSDKIKKLAEFYQVGVKDPKPAELLFAVHTYYALFMKLLAAEIVAYFHKLPTPLQKMMRAGTSAQLKREMDDLEAGSIFRHLNITNFLEGDLFAWYTGVWTEPIEKLVRDMVARLDNYNPGTLSEDPAGSRDLLKKLYQQLFPKSVRHDLGEYYTPDWLAEHVLNELGYAGDPDKRLLDPACGSGTFLVMAINRIRHWYDENRERCRFDEGELGRKILANVIGFDLNPLAVMAARTNYLIAIRDLIGRVEKVEIPVYLCDSILTPSEYGGLFAGRLGKAKELKTAAAKFLIPTEIATNRDDLAKYADQIEFCVKNGYSPKEFIQRCQDEGLPVSAENLHTDLYKELVKLDKANRNGVWARIIKNAFAPLFIGRADYVAGNPPWVNWENLPGDYRNTLKPMWSRYGLFTLTGSEARLGGGKKDLSMLFVYACVDNYLKSTGKIGFVITQSLFKSKGAGDGFRLLKFADGGTMVFIRPQVVSDLHRIQVFEGATNRTAVFIASRHHDAFKYPVDYIEWSGPSRIPQDWSLDEVKKQTRYSNCVAMPLELDRLNSPWLTMPKEVAGSLRKMIGKGSYQAHAGVYTGGLNGCFWIRVLKRLAHGNLLIENMHDVGKRKVEQVQATIEGDLVYPLLRGRDVQRWQSEPSAHIIIAQDPNTRSGIPEGEMKRKYPNTFAYLQRFEPELRMRGSSSIRRMMETGAFYTMFAVGPYTFSRFKLLWRYIATEFTCCAEESDNGLVIPDHRLICVEAQNHLEVHYLAALLNSSPVRLLVSCFTIGTQMAPHILNHIRVPKFHSSDQQHVRLAHLASKCQASAREGKLQELEQLEVDLNRLAAVFWDINITELNEIGSVLARYSAEPVEAEDAED
jgi:hypothetical protein